ncbi:MAG: T9SS type A sorting domain-containing protein [Bacteroidetes bacterium]|nr:T9SS type A sorting domain-containing protein [Bacteroidota bacterium]
MKKIYIWILIFLFVNIGKAQNIAFEQVEPNPADPYNSGNLSGGLYCSIAFADVDNDNDQDVLITGNACYIPACTKLYTNDGNGLYTAVVGASIDNVREGSIAFADIDNDNDEDLLITGLAFYDPDYAHVYGITKLYRNDGSGSYTEVTGTPFDFVIHSSIAFADIDNDNDQDVLITGLSLQGIISKLYRNDGNGNYTEVTGTPFNGVHFSSVAFTDIDNDNDQDVLITGERGYDANDSSMAKLYINDGSGNYTEKIGTPFWSVERGSVAFADIDNDNDQDVLITGESSSYQRIAKLYTNDGNGNFTEKTGTPFIGVCYSSIAFSDVDNDNDQDVLITGGINNGSNHCIAKLYTNDGSGNFTEVSGTPFDGVELGSVAFADIDNDNDQDVLVTGNNNSDKRTAKLYRNISTAIGISEHTVMDQISIYSNPNNGLVNIDLGILKNVSIKVFNVYGQLIFQKENINTSIYQFDLNKTQGIYFIRLEPEGQNPNSFKLFVE